MAALRRALSICYRDLRHLPNDSRCPGHRITQLIKDPVCNFHATSSHGHISSSGNIHPTNSSSLTLSPAFAKLLPAHGCRILATRSFRSEHINEDKDHSQQLHFHDHGWMIRLANENGYLSWCRNVYIATIAGATAHSQLLLLPYAKEAGILLIFMGALNLLSGTGSYMYNIVSLRRRMQMSGLSVLYSLTMALTHLVLWVGAMMIYLGYVEEEPEQTGVTEEGKST